MTFRDNIKICWRALSSNKLRSLLTIVGIVIGVLSIILIVSVGQGAKFLIINQLQQSFGPKTLSIEPGKLSTDISSQFTSMFSNTLKDTDIEALQKKINVPYLDDLSPIVMVQGGNIVYQKDVFSGMTIGSSPLLTSMYGLELAEGKLFDRQDIEQYSRVIVVGSDVKDKLFGMDSAIDKKVRIKNQSFQVIGAFAPRGTIFGFNIDQLALVPYTTAQKYLNQQDYYNEIVVQVESEKMVPQTVQDIEATLRETHRITDPSNDDFHVITQEDIIKQINTITGILTIFLAAVAAISLIVGGIGIMNTMLVSVTQRIKEIGLRKAMGATKKEILNQFLLESSILTLIGGMVGILLGILIGQGASFLLGYIIDSNWPFTFPVWAALLGVGVSILTGLIFGILPARKAANLNPVEALRRE